MLVLASCVNIEPIKGRLADLEARLKAVEDNLNAVSTNANGLSSAIKALQDNVTVDKVVKNDNGYTITFTDGTYATIINGKDGRLLPGGSATRAEAATMLMRFSTLPAA